MEASEGRHGAIREVSRPLKGTGGGLEAIMRGMKAIQEIWRLLN